MPWVIATIATLVAVIVWFDAQPTDEVDPTAQAPSEPVAGVLAEARHALSAKQFARAEQLASEAIRSEPHPDPALFLIAGEAATRQGRHNDALAYYAGLPDDGSDNSVTALLAAGEILLQDGRLSEAEARFRAARSHWPDHPLPNNRLALLLGMTGRGWESSPYLLKLVQLNQFSVQALCLLANVDAFVKANKQFAPVDPGTASDPLPLLASARQKIDENELETAQRLLQRVLALDPGLTEARARLGRILAESGSAAEFAQWRQSLPEKAFSHPEIWLVLGEESLRRNLSREAARCFWEATRLHPESRAANYQLGQILQSLGRPEDAVAYLERAALQEELAILAGLLNHQANHIPNIYKSARATEKLGRYWESWAWSRAALAIDPTLRWAQDQERAMAARLRPDLPITAVAKLPVVDLTDYPLPEVPTAGLTDDEDEFLGEGRIAFVDDAARVGINFGYYKGAPADQPTHRMYEFTGGGVGAADYDNDGLPDLCFSQGCDWPPGGPSGEWTDRLFRNLGDRFADVTTDAGLEETIAGFGQGVACGDFDGDGFVDIYVGNVGRNRLLRNNGDGTFTDASDTAGLPDAPLTDAWTTSVLIADLNGDGLPDLFDVNYMTGSNIFERVCRDEEQRERSCDPKTFPACPDRLLLNLGDGRFADVTEPAGITAPDGNGLGIVASNFDGSGRLSLFVANDGTNNHFYSNVTSSPAGPPRFEERALIAGLAVDRAGLPQACMGVAADDIDGDGALDLFVTNFHNESNTLYRQLPYGGFEDATIDARLRDAGYQLLGFGTQFFDADLDGWSDLIITNGHVDDYRFKGDAYHMPPQFHKNIGGRFQELSSETLGPFFAGEYLGRGLSLLDWNGDGREDVVINHLDAPSALLTNHSDAGHWLGIRLVATRTARDAIGSIVTVESTNGRRVRHLTAGDGYLASNERRLTFGLGAANRVKSLAVLWPSGASEHFDGLDAGGEFLLVEGRGTLLGLSASHSRASQNDAVTRF